MTTAEEPKNPNRQLSATFDKHSHDIIDFAAARARDEAIKSLTATLKARLGADGHQVYDCGNQDFLVTRWNMSRYCPDLAALRLFARVVGVDHG